MSPLRFHRVPDISESTDLNRCRFPFIPALIGTLAAMNVASVVLTLIE
ncbi:MULTISPECIES: hypothetical protein [Microvirga]|nr:hypothetical protein [Microvirga lenta]MCB5176619.1 hypothetical protein [Microvirga lenta]